MSSPWETALMADGPKVVEWLERTSILARIRRREAPRGGSQMRRINDWRKGGMATVHAIDRILTDYGSHLSQLPDDVWLDITWNGK